MAVTLSAVELASALRIGDGTTALVEPQAGIVNRLLGAATAIVQEYAPDAPDLVLDEGAIRVAAFLFDNDGSRNRRFSDVLANSGALSILQPFRVQRALSLDGVAAAIASGDTSGLTVSQVLALIALWAREGDPSAIPVGKLANAGGSGGGLFVASTTQPASRNPGPDPNGDGFSRQVGVSGYSPVTDEDIQHANPTSRVITDLAGWRGGIYNNLVSARSNTGISLESSIWLGYGYTTPVYLFVTLGPEAQGLDLGAVTQLGINIPVTQQAGLTIRGEAKRVWVSDQTYTQAEIDAGDFELTITSTGPATFNRYMVVNQNQTATAGDFTGAGVQTGASSTVQLPNAGWSNGKGYVHIAMPASEGAPTVIGEAGGFNYRPFFEQQSDVVINGDTMQTWSTSALVYFVRGAPLWLVESL